MGAREILAVLEDEFEPNEIFRLVVPLDLCPTANHPCWRNKTGYRLRAEILTKLSEQIMYAGKWRTGVRQQALRIVDATKASAATGKRKSHIGARAAAKIDKLGMREIRVVRASAVQPDPTAMYEQLKLPLDALVRCGVLWDDSSQFLKIASNEWKKAPRDAGFVKIGVFDIKLQT